MEKKKITLAIAGLGGRGRGAYSNYALAHSEEMEVVAAADICEDALNLVKQDWNLPEERCFHSAGDMLSGERLADIAVIATQDRDHVPHALAALKAGYHLLLEKPVAVDMDGCIQILNAARKYKRHVVVCHVLRYTPFYNKIKTLIDTGTIGDVVTIQAAENVGYWHHAHSFVRGNWRNKEESSPMILAKCCHDMDILVWLTGKRPLYVSSFGDNYHFNKAHAPEEAALRCCDCAIRKECPYDAVRFYLESPDTGVRGGHTGWPVNVLNPIVSEQTIAEALRSGPYGRCVYHCDNNVVDHQVVNLALEDGVTVNFTMSAFSDSCYRTIRVMGTKGTIEGNMDESRLVWKDFLGHQEIYDVSVNKEEMAGHGGGDKLMMDELVQLIRGDSMGSMQTSIEQSIESHLVALLAEESRLRNGESLPVRL